MADEWDELEKGGGWVDTEEAPAPAGAEEAVPTGGDEWDELEKGGGWVDTKEEVPVPSEIEEETPASAGVEEAAPAGGDEWDELEKGGGWVDTGEEAATTLEKVKAAVAPKAKPTAPPEVKKGFFREFFGGDSWGIGLLLVIAILIGITGIAIGTNNIGLTGLVIGALIGFAFQKGRFCLVMAHRDILLSRDYTMMKALIFCLILIMVGYQLVADLGILAAVTGGQFKAISPRPFMWLAQLLGGFIFGIGAVLAGGCAAGTSYRAGEGYIGNMIAMVTLMLGGAFAMMGALKPITGGMPNTPTAGWLKTPISGIPIKGYTVPSVLGMDNWTVIIGVIILVAIIWILKSGFKLPEIIPKGGISLEKIVKRKWTKWKAGGVIAVILVAGLLAHSAAFHSEYVKAINDGKSEADASKIAGDVGGHNYSICAACGLVRLMKHYFSTGSGLFEWSGLMMVGLVIGAFISAQFAGEFALRVPEGKIILQAALGGLLMGLSASTMLGCTVGHILSGAPILAIGSLLAWFSIAMGVWITTYMLFMRD